MNGAEVLQPVFRFLDRQIQERGDILYVMFVYLAIPFIAWLLGRRSGRRNLKQNHTFILVVRPPAQPPPIPPVIQWKFEPPGNGGSPFGTS